MTKEEMQALVDLLKPIQDDISAIKSDITTLKDGQKSLEQGQKELGKKVTSLELKMENEVNRSIKVTMEGHMDLNRKLDEKVQLDKRVETLEHKMSAVEFAIKKAE